jgi:DNA-binding beta-propeller fold protein YncE
MVVKHKQPPGSCPECDVGAFTRNHYFTGKLLVERDFRQEQQYYIDKLRLHARRLSGTGVVCGLKVTPHPTCPDRFVCIEPGMAIDCCGHDILVVDEDCIDLTAIPSVKKLIDKPDGKPHSLQICIRYRECPSEPIPVLYDDCGCDDSQCAPNRILESYELDVMVDQPPASASPDEPSLAWKSTINVAHASQVALSEATKSLFVVTSDDPGFVYQVSTDNGSILTSHDLGHRALAVAVSNGGDRVYVVAEGSAADRELHVLDATAAGLPLIQAAPIAISGSAGSQVILKVTPSPAEALLTLLASGGQLLRWGNDINTSATPAAPATVATFGANQISLALSSDAASVYASDGSKLQTAPLATGVVSAVSGLPAGAAPAALALIAATGGDLLAIADQPARKLYLLNPSSATVVGSVLLTHPSLAGSSIAVSPDGRWSYVVEQEAGKSYVEPVDTGSLQLGEPVLPATVLAVGPNSAAPLLDSTGESLFVPFTGDTNVPTAGGVAVITVSETACCDLVWRSLDGCPECDKADCLVLAAITNFVPGDSFAALPADSNDAANHIARIDNHVRKLLPSTQTLAEIVECLCQSGRGGKGPKGDPGASGGVGPAGPSIDAVAAQFVACDQPGSATIAMVGNARTLELVIPGACNHDFAHICGITWDHKGSVDRNKLLNEPGLIIAFDREIDLNDVTEPGVVQVLGPSAGRATTCWCEIATKQLRAVNVKLTFNPNGTASIDLSTISAPTAAKPANAIQIILSNIPASPATQGNVTLRVVVNGDFIRSKDANGVVRGADIDHLPEWLPKRLTGDGIEGGVFVSWFQVKG